MISRIYPHSYNGQNSCNCNVDTYIRVPNKEKIEELKNELEKYGKVFINEHCTDPITELHLIVQVPYKIERYKND